MKKFFSLLLFVGLLVSPGFGQTAMTPQPVGVEQWHGLADLGAENSADGIDRDVDPCRRAL